MLMSLSILAGSSMSENCILNCVLYTHTHTNCLLHTYCSTQPQTTETDVIQNSESVSDGMVFSCAV